MPSLTKMNPSQQMYAKQEKAISVPRAVTNSNAVRNARNHEMKAHQSNDLILAQATRVGGKSRGKDRRPASIMPLKPSENGLFTKQDLEEHGSQTIPPVTSHSKKTVSKIGLI